MEVAKKQVKQNEDPYYLREKQRYENPIPSREYILEVLMEFGKPIKRSKLAKMFKLKGEDANEALRRRLNAMVRDCQAVKTKLGYAALSMLKEVTGRLTLERDGFGTIVSEEEGLNVKLSPKEVKGFYDGDILKARIIKYDRQGIAFGTIDEVVELKETKIVGRIIVEEDQEYVEPLQKKYFDAILLQKTKKADYVPSDIVIVKVQRDKKTALFQLPQGEVIDVLGNDATAGIDVEMAYHKFNLPHIFPDAVTKQAQKFPEHVTPQSKRGRKDYTDVNFVTIDGEDARDFDDAVYCEARKGGGWYLYVAIADVGHYVKSGTALDKEAKERGNSVYFPGCVVPMLPEALSNGLCSLNPKVDRLALVCEMTISAQGKVTRAQFFEGVIHSAARLTYTIVASLIEGEKTYTRKHGELLPEIFNLYECYQAFAKQRKVRGAIEFETIETHILFDKLGRVESVLPRERNIAHRIIEECMLAANVSAAKFLIKNKKPTLFRNHNSPPEEKLKALRDFLSELGLDLPGGQTPKPLDYTNLLEKIKGREDSHVIESVLLRSLSQAEYGAKNEGHFGLAYPAYLHFTSPIRRYPDLITHRQIVSVLREATKKPEDKDQFADVGEHCSMSERRADEASRDVVMALKCRYMEDKVNEIYHGVITGVTSFGLFVELEEIYIDGLVHVTTLGNDYYYFEPFKHRLIGERTRRIFKLGDTLTVKVVKVAIDDRKIDLEPVESKTEEPQKSKKMPKGEKKEKKRSRSKKKSKKRQT